ncbi:Dynein beta chain, ciliary [Merluccius polli]|uniref:Dynein beta chain, ciliary n=1 Tax=Merluccius polli TaxID=89951 RepID=A0AA47ND07_MERPO|nr:Dynein beta chain, ciliary [Merluccius polli]
MVGLNTLNKVPQPFLQSPDVNLMELKIFPNPPAAVINVSAAVMVLLAPHGHAPKDWSWKAARAFMDKTWGLGLLCLLAEVWLHLGSSRLDPGVEDLDMSLQHLTAQFKRAVSHQPDHSAGQPAGQRAEGGGWMEKKRWSQAVVQYTEQQKTLCGDVLLATASVSYLGYFTRQYRLELLCQRIPFLHSLKARMYYLLFRLKFVFLIAVSILLTDHLDPVHMLTSNAMVATWHNQGLPGDRMSIENAAILTTSERWPLVIDPQQQGFKWIRTQYASQLGPERVESVSNSHFKETKINKAQELYRPAAERASLLHFIINNLSLINPMYQFSLKAFNTVFIKTMGQAEQDVQARVDHLTEAITYSVFLYTSQGLFQRDKLTLLSHTAFQLAPYPSFLPKPGELIKRAPERECWRKIAESKCPEKERLPHDWKHRSSLPKLIILRAMWPDRMTYLLKNFVAESMGSRYVEFEKSFEDSGPLSPVFFILSPGVNPLKHGFSIDQGTLHNVSLGQGQEKGAERVLMSASQRGITFTWWHASYLCWRSFWRRWRWTLTRATGCLSVVSRHHTPSIPRGVLDNAVKIANKPPTGMSASLHAALHNFIQSKRWNQNYPFNSGDLTISVKVLYNYLEANTKVPLFLFLSLYLFGEIMYGGHITDDWDRRLCKDLPSGRHAPQDGEANLPINFST